MSVFLRCGSGFNYTERSDIPWIKANRRSMPGNIPNLSAAVDVLESNEKAKGHLRSVNGFRLLRLKRSSLEDSTENIAQVIFTI